MPETATLPVENLQWEQYLEQLDLNNPALAQYLRSVLGALPNAVPQAGEYTTSMDYETLNGALRAQYVTEVIKKYQGQLGDVTDLVSAATTAGYLTPEQASALTSAGFTNVGSLQQQYASQGGLRTLAGPYQAARTEIVQQAMADMDAASQKASSDAYELAQQTTGLRVQALGEAGRQGVGLVGHGVSRMNSKGMEGMGGEGPGMELPVPERPDRPAWWEALLPAIAGAGVAGLTRYLGQPEASTPEKRAEEQYRYEQERARLRGDATAQAAAPERAPGYGEDQSASNPTYSAQNPFQDYGGEMAYGGGQSMPSFGGGWGGENPYGGGQSMSGAGDIYGENPYGGGQSMPSYDLPNYSGGSNGPTYGWQTPMPSYQAPQDYGTSYQNDWGSNYDNYDYGTSYQGDYGYNYDVPSYDYGTSYQGDYGYADYGYDDYSGWWY